MALEMDMELLNRPNIPIKEHGYKVKNMAKVF